MRSLAAAVLLAAACSGNPPNGNGGGGGGGSAGTGGSGNPGCTAPTTSCGSTCADLKTDDKNCGSCGTVCDGGTACANGACFVQSCLNIQCPPSTVCANGTCQDKACVGVLCPEGQTCSQGSCLCGGDSRTCGTTCINLKNDNNNCGACNNVCPMGSSCAGGACLLTSCGGTTCDALSVCYQGACVDRSCVNVPCAAGLVCSAGQCGCPTNQIACNGQCVSLDTDSMNCGHCGSACPMGSRCAGGQCFNDTCGTQTCDPLSVCQMGNCVPSACVGIVCSGGKSCAGGACTCPMGQVDCGGTCVTLNSSTGNCGACGRTCTTAQSCVNGDCVTNSCTGGQKLCSGMCTDTTTDPNNCGDCGAACGGGRNCVGGVCACPTGLTFCGSTCVNVANDGNNCGMCGHGCNGGVCNTGTCSCSTSMTLCGTTCSNTYTDPLNCGMCGKGCASGQSCNGGTCLCAPGFSLCGSACVPTSTDNMNCGGCNVVCQSGTFCNNSQCLPMFTCQNNFTTAPADCPLIPIDISQCGVQAAQPSSSMPFTGMVPGAQTVLTPFTMSASETVYVTGSVLSANGANTADNIFLRNYMNNNLTGNRYVANNISPPNVYFGWNGSPFACAQPVTVGQFDDQPNSPTNYTLDLQLFEHNGKWNTGGSVISSAPMLTASTTIDGGTPRVCDQVCGFISFTCGDDREYYKLVLPPKKAVVIDGVFSAYQNYRPWVDIYNNVGGIVCRAINIGDLNVYNMPAAGRGRVINNTDVPQTIYITPYTNWTENYNLAISVEP
jgi:hypothetical protein